MADPAYEIVTVAYRSRAPLGRLLERLPASIPVIVVDNSRGDEDLSELVESRPNTRYLDSGGNVGFGAACNLGARHSTRPFLIFLNPDTAPAPRVFLELIGELERDPSCGACGPALADATGAAQRGAGGWQPTVLRAVAHATGWDRVAAGSGIWFCDGAACTVEVEWLSGTCLAVRRAVFLEVGGFDARYFLYQEDMDLGRRLRGGGYRQLLRADLRVPHAGGGSSPGSSSDRLWSLRGRMLREYLTAYEPPLRAALLRGVLGAGYVARAVLFRLRAEPVRAAEMRSYARALLGRTPMS